MLRNESNSFRSVCKERFFTTSDDATSFLDGKISFSTPPSPSIYLFLFRPPSLVRCAVTLIQDHFLPFPSNLESIKIAYANRPSLERARRIGNNSIVFAGRRHRAARTTLMLMCRVVTPSASSTSTGMNGRSRSSSRQQVFVIDLGGMYKRPAPELCTVQSLSIFHRRHSDRFAETNLIEFVNILIGEN